MRGLYSSVGFAALVVSCPALAQQAEPGTPMQTARAQAGDTAAPAQSPVGLEDIVVTAQRRSENLSKVPIAVTSVSQELATQLNIRDIQTMTVITPGLSITTGIGYAMTYIRGVGAAFSSPGVENPVSVYIDGAYVERGKGGNLDLMDVSSVQVLKGPQGTLWGRNSTGGSILVNTADPEFTIGGRVTGEIGNQDHRLIEGVVNVPLSDTLAIRVAGRYRTDGGYIRNLPDDYMLGWAHDSSIRGKILWKPSAEFTATATIQRDVRKNSLPANAQFLPDVYCSLCSQSGYTHPYADPYTTAINLLNNGVGTVAKNDRYNLRLQYSLDKFTISTVTAYEKNRTDDFVDADLTNVNGVPGPGGLNFVIPSSNKTFNQNVTVTSDFGGMFEGLVGIDYLNDNSTYALHVVPNLQQPFAPANLAYVKTTSISPFAEVNVKPTERLTITVGGRYTRDERDGRRTGESDKHLVFNSFSPRLVIAYDTGPVNLYASYNRGNKAGGFSTPASVLSAFLPETLDGYEVGAKFVSSDRRFRANIAGFYYDYKQLQVQAIDQGGENVATFQNPDAQIYGFDADANWKATDWLELIGGASVLHSEFRNFDNAGVQVVTFDAQGRPTGMRPGTESLTGFPLPHAPKFSGFIGATLSGELGDGWQSSVTALVNYSSSFTFFPGGGGPLRADTQPSYATARISGEITPADERFSIGFYVDNLTDKLTYNHRYTTAPYGSGQQVNRPRTYGLRLSVKY
jgi:iron complex outermembrane receptor protein